MNRRRRSLAFVLLAACVLAATPAAAQLAPLPLDRGATGLALALRRVGVTARVLYVTAHPDDEHNGVLVRLSRGQGVRTALLTLTRGDGGQNEIGTELFEALGVLRTEELAAIHRYDAVGQYFGHSYEFGYSFSTDETFAKWGRDDALADVVRVVRMVRPDVILTLALEGPGGGQHHQAAAQLARDAFRAAADPGRFPEQAAAGLVPWQARKIYQGGVGGGSADPTAERRVTLSTSVYDPVLGASWQQLGSVARALHRSQGSSQLMAPAGQGEAAFALVDAEPAISLPEGDVLDGIDVTLGGLLRFAPAHETAAPFLRPALSELQSRVDAARRAFDPAAPEKTLPPLQAALAGQRGLVERVRASALDPSARDEIASRLRDEERDLLDALRLAHGLEVDVAVDDDLAVPGQAVTITTRIANQGTAPVTGVGVAVRAGEGWTVIAEDGAALSLQRGEAASFRHRVIVAPGARPSGPYWRRDPGADRFVLTSPAHAGLPWSPPEVEAEVSYGSSGARVSVLAPAQWRYAWRTGGEKQKVLAVVPDFTVRLAPEVTVVPTAGGPARREFRVAVRNHRQGKAAGRLYLEVPPGWTVDPPEVAVLLRHEEEEVAVRMTVTPARARGAAQVAAVFEADGRQFRDDEQVIAYEHVQERRLYRPAVARVVFLEVAVAPGTSVGYVEGAGDDVDTAIRQLGVPVTHLTPDDLAFADLSRYSTIVTGIRAYQTRPDLRSHHDRLMKYVADGGHLVVQYNKFEFNQISEAPRAGGFSGSRPDRLDSPFAPYPAAVSAQRVTEETAPPTILAPASPLLGAPNRIRPADFEGWVQERGLYFLEARDPRYVDVLAFTDPFPKNPGEKRGALVEAKVGKGTWTYVGLGLFRQLPAGVPGAYRLLANLVSRERPR